MEAFYSRSYYGNGLGAAAPVAGTQQGDAAVVASSLQNLASAAMKTGDPLVAAAAQVGAALAQIVSLFGPNPNNTYATEVVNQVEADVLQPNLAAWQATPDAQKTIAGQQAFETVFNGGWQYVLSACNNPALGSAGINCLKDRQRGGKFDWFKLYYDPIATDPAPAANAALVAANPAAITSSVTGAVDSTVASISTATGLSPLMIGVGLIAFALVLVSD
jgi:hypothetical protein